MMKIFAHEDLKKSPPKVGYLSRISVISEIFLYYPELTMAQTIEFMFSNVAFRATVYRSEVDSIFCAAFFIRITQPLLKTCKNLCLQIHIHFFNLLTGRPGSRNL